MNCLLNGLVTLLSDSIGSELPIEQPSDLELPIELPHELRTY